MLLGLDLGTGSAKALLLDDEGAVVAEVGAAYPMDRPRPGWAETHPARWWEAVVATLQQLPREQRAAVRGIGLSGQMHGVVLCDAEGEPVRPALLWLDTRAAECLALYPEHAEHTTGNTISAGMAGPMLLWLERHEPGALRAARWAMQPKDWLQLRLTGKAATDPSDASGTLLADRDGQWADALISRLGIRRELLAQPVPSWCAHGPVHGRGSGAGRAGRRTRRRRRGRHPGGGPGQRALRGSRRAARHREQRPGGGPPRYLARLLASAERVPQRQPGGPSRWCLMAAMLNGGAALKWARATLNLTWDEAFSRAFTEGAATGDVEFLPYLSGERSPWMDPHLRGGWMGVGAADDAGVLMRAALTGVAFGIRAGLDALRAQGAAPERLRLAGGGTVHAGSRQLLADAIGLPLDAVACPNAMRQGHPLRAAEESVEPHATGAREAHRRAALEQAPLSRLPPQGDARGHSRWESGSRRAGQARRMARLGQALAAPTASKARANHQDSQ
jgi:xylulokinase